MQQQLQIATSLASRSTNLNFGSNTMVDTYFLGDTESAVPSAFSISEMTIYCGWNSCVGALTELALDSMMELRC